MNSLNSLGLSFLICRMGIIVSTSSGVVRIREQMNVGGLAQCLALRKGPLSGISCCSVHHLHQNCPYNKHCINHKTRIVFSNSQWVLDPSEKVPMELS